MVTCLRSGQERVQPANLALKLRPQRRLARRLLYRLRVLHVALEHCLLPLLARQPNLRYLSKPA